MVLEPDERNLALLRKGQRAVVSAEAYPSQSFDATLGYIAPAVNGERGTIEIRLDVPEPPSYLRPNMTVSVELQIETRRDGSNDEKVREAADAMIAQLREARQALAV